MDEDVGAMQIAVGLQRPPLGSLHRVDVSDTPVDVQEKLSDIQGDVPLKTNRELLPRMLDETEEITAGNVGDRHPVRAALEVRGDQAGDHAPAGVRFFQPLPGEEVDLFAQTVIHGSGQHILGELDHNQSETKALDQLLAGSMGLVRIEAVSDVLVLNGKAGLTVMPTRKVLDRQMGLGEVLVGLAQLQVSRSGHGCVRFE